MEEIKAKSSDLSQAIQKVGSELYKQAQEKKPEEGREKPEEGEYKEK